jgi:hypothetical protein
MNQGHGKRAYFILTIFTAGVFWAGGLFAQSAEVYTWTDEDGVVHFSDSPPAAGRADQINVEGVYKPGTTGMYPEAQPGTAPSSDLDEADAPKSAAQQRREEIARNREENRKADAEARQLCGQHRQRLTQMEPARRVFYTNEQGEQVRMDDDQRMQLIEESKQYLAEHCD